MSSNETLLRMYYECKRVLQTIAISFLQCNYEGIA
jgi:hypothetical protein